MPPHALPSTNTSLNSFVRTESANSNSGAPIVYFSCPPHNELADGSGPGMIHTIQSNSNNGN